MPIVENPETEYAITPDGVYLAYQTMGAGPLDIVWQPDWPGNIDFEWELFDGVSFLRDWASFSRVITHDQRGIGLSSRNVPLPDLETRVADLRLVLDVVGADRVVLCGIFNSGGVHILFAATYPERVQSLVWIEPGARTLRTADYPWGTTGETASPSSPWLSSGAPPDTAAHTSSIRRRRGTCFRTTWRRWPRSRVATRARPMSPSR
jgi:pimeloyl-ACP methyl ester carboxylesterase